VFVASCNCEPECAVRSRLKLTRVHTYAHEGGEERKYR
jgi:hypothetical protein